MTDRLRATLREAIEVRMSAERDSKDFDRRTAGKVLTGRFAEHQEDLHAALAAAVYDERVARDALIAHLDAFGPAKPIPVG